MVDSLDERSESVDIPDDPDSVDEAQFIEWMKKHGEPIKDVLSEMTAIYHHDDEKLPIRNSRISHAPPSADYVGVQFDFPNNVDPDVEGANILRVLDDLTAHEVAHLNYTPLESKQEFTECYPGWGRLPGAVCNILEDEYIDAERQREYYGMREKLAYMTWLHMNTEKRSPPVDQTYAEEGMANALENGLLQLALSGYVKGVEDAPDEVGAALAEVEPFIERVRTTHDPDDRMLLMHATMQTFATYLDEPEEFDPEAAAERRRDGDDGGRDPSSPAADEPEIDLPDPIEDELKEMLDEIAEDADEMPCPDPDDMPIEDGEMGEMAPDDGDDTEGSGSDDSPLDDIFGDDSGSGGGDTTDGDTEPTDGDTADTAGGSGSDGDDDKRDLKSIVAEYGPSSLTVTK